MPAIVLRESPTDKAAALMDVAREREARRQAEDDEAAMMIILVAAHD
jgi:hypothetical protein